VSVEDAANAVADEEIPKPKTTDTSPVCEEPHHAATLLVAGRTRHDSIANTIYDSFQRWSSDGSTFTAFPSFLTARSRPPKSRLRDDDDDDDPSGYGLSPSFPIDWAAAFNEASPPKKKKSEAAFSLFALNFTSSVQRTGFCLLAYLQEEKKITRQQYVYHFLACHTRGMARDRKRWTAYLLAYRDRAGIAIFSGNQDEKAKGQNRPCHLAFGDRLFIFFLLLLPHFQRSWLLPTPFFSHEMLPNWT
jgi:hypothetical protein